MTSKDRDTEAVEIQASQWILRRDRDNFGSKERGDLEAWLSEDSDHRQAYLRLLEAWQVSVGLSAWRPVDGRVRTDVLGEPLSPAREQSPARRFALAACVVTALCVACLLGWTNYVGKLTYTTHIGGYQRILLEDGSVVELNTDTQVRVHYTSEGREVYLQRGEAFFDIAHDPKRPFNVITTDTTVRAIGTQFDVHRTESGTEVTVKQGAVKVSATASPNPIPLSAGQAANAQVSGIHLSQVEPGEISRRLAWQVGELHFSNQPLARVAAEFNRYNRRRLEVSPAIGSAAVGGNFKVNDLDSFVAALRGSLPVRVEATGDVIRISNIPP